MTNKIQKNQIRKIEKVLKEMGFDVDDYSGKINKKLLILLNTN